MPPRPEWWPPTEERPQLFFVIGAGRCGLLSLSTLLHLSGVHEAFQGRMPDRRPLLWAPSEPRREVMRRKLQTMRRCGGGANVGEVNPTYLSYVPSILELEPDARFVVLRRDKRETCESWYYWTEAGSERQVEGMGTMPVHLNAKNHWMRHDGSNYEFTEDDLTFPDVEGARDKREAIELYVEQYYYQVSRLAARWPSNFRLYQMEELFDAVLHDSDDAQYGSRKCDAAWKSRPLGASLCCSS